MAQGFVLYCKTIALAPPLFVSHASATVCRIGMATTLQWQPRAAPLPVRAKSSASARHLVSVQAFRRSDIDGFAKRMASGEAWRDAWRSANDGFERFIFEARKAAERLDRRYSVSRRLSSVAQSAAARAREFDREFEIGPRWRTFSMDFSRNWPRVCFFSLFISLCVFQFSNFLLLQLI